ncbi:molybdopterin molybdotransferase MoeA [Candidatus Margulisiibacteriota bacterium]
MITSIEAQEIISQNITSLPLQTLDIRDSLGFVLAYDVMAQIDLPPFNKSAMDGYVIGQGDDLSDDNRIFEVAGIIQAGQVYEQNIPKGKAIKIMTGAMLPPNAGKVIIKENVSTENNSISVEKIDLAKNICLKGEDITNGKKLYSAGQKITPLILANIISAGISKVDVYSQPRFGILATGSELLECGSEYKAGHIYNSNGPLLHSLLNQRGYTTIQELSGQDTLELLRQRFEELLDESDIVFLTGGVSAGDFDFVEEILQQTNCTVHFNKIAVKPGKPFTFATKDNKLIFAFPGNPVSVFTSFFLFALPALYQAQGTEFKHAIAEYELAVDFKRDKTRRELYLPVSVVNNSQMAPVDYHGSGDLYGLSKADGLMIVPAGVNAINKGEKAAVIKIC